VSNWTIDTLKRNIYNAESLDTAQTDSLLDYMNRHFPPKVFQEHLLKGKCAVENAKNAKHLLEGALQSFPQVLNHSALESGLTSLNGFAVVFTAGGEGERLRLSLLNKGVSADDLRDFTKATYPLKNFYKDFGALQINLAMIGWICSIAKIDIPVIVTTGPQGSLTHSVIPKVLKEHNNFGLKNLRVIAQDERLHFTSEDKIAIQIVDGRPIPVTNPDETGGPLMKLKQKPNADTPSALEWLASLGCAKILIVQGTAIYEPRMLSLMAAAAKEHDCVGVGIPRTSFEPKDPFGTFVTVEKEGGSKTCIIEQDIRNDATRLVKDETSGAFLPFNTGFYALDCELLLKESLPDYATPPKEVLPGLPRSPKIGYAATDILPLAKQPLILTVESDMYAVIKTAEDLDTLSETAIRFGLKEIVMRDFL